MSLLLEEMRRSYRAQRGVSQGAAITLVSRSGGYTASFECAIRCSQILGTRNLTDRADNGERMPVLKISTEDLHRAITKLSEAFSVALVDTASDENGTRFVLVWKITPKQENPVSADASKDNQGLTDLDEY